MPQKLVNYKKYTSGFTLIEVLVAVAIFAIVATAVQKTVAQNLQLSHQLENKTIASWIAENRLNEVRIFPDAAKGRKQSDVEMAGRKWKVTTEIENTKNEKINRVDVSVGLVSDTASEPENYITLSGFVLSEN